MALHPDDPWYVLPGDPRYRRAQALSEMQRYIETTERAHGSIPRHRAAAVADRRRCLENWQDYLDGKISMRTGRKPVAEEERFAKVHITLPPGLYKKVLELRRNGESESALIARLLDSHPDVLSVPEPPCRDGGAGIGPKLVPKPP